MEILVVDDEPNIRTSMSLHLKGGGHQVRVAATVDEALAAGRAKGFDVAFVDVRLGAATGLDLLPRLMDVRPQAVFVIMTAFASLETAVEALRRGAADYLAKPFGPAELDLSLARATRLARLQTRVRSLESDQRDQGTLLLDTACPAMAGVLTLARKVADSDSRVLLRGESGTGKSVLARAIHGWSPRADGPFVTVSCPAIPADLLESELFGHARGAFTGATADQPGRVASAEGGTLLLDEIGDLPVALQAKILRFVQEGEFERVGEGITRRADVRLLAATHADLQAAVAAGTFREDLYYRLAVVTLELPPLRERREDIPQLAQGLLKTLARRRPGITLSTGAIGALQARHWPGNVRELRNVLERAVIFAETDVIGEDLVADAAAGRASAGAAPRVGDRVTLAAIQDAHVEAVVARASSQKEAAEILGIDPATLWRRRRQS